VSLAAATALHCMVQAPVRDRFQGLAQAAQHGGPIVHAAQP